MMFTRGQEYSNRRTRDQETVKVLLIFYPPVENLSVF